LATQLDQGTFTGLLDYYYQHTAVVPKQHAQQYQRGLLAAQYRAEAALRSWEATAEAIEPTRTAEGSVEPLLDLGCGTAPLMVAAAKMRGQQILKLVGVDIALRWLVVAKKRLSEAKVEAPLICACAEALPFPNRTFRTVAAESVLENVQKQRTAVSELYRVLQPGCFLFASTPNRFSPGPDPHVGIWGGSLLPRAWLAAIVRRQGGIPPERHLLSARSLQRLLHEAGFDPVRISLPTIPIQQRERLGSRLRPFVDMYHLTLRLPAGRAALLAIGPLLYAVAQTAAIATREPLSNQKVAT
jgi:SAM-dependent methyltransferase